ncbi:MAG: hypothetical protein ABI356_04975, partial [Steroidobacteraceae bacterium]
ITECLCNGGKLEIAQQMRIMKARGPRPFMIGATVSPESIRSDAMKTNLHLGFTGNCDAAFAFYETVFGTKRLMTMKYGDAPPGVPSIFLWMSPTKPR